MMHDAVSSVQVICCEIIVRGEDETVKKIKKKIRVMKSAKEL